MASGRTKPKARSTAKPQAARTKVSRPAVTKAAVVAAEKHLDTAYRKFVREFGNSAAVLAVERDIEGPVLRPRLRIHVPMSQARHLRAAVAAFPQAIGSVGVEIVRRGPAVVAQDSPFAPTVRTSIVQPGIWIGRQADPRTHGTLGLVVRDDNNIFLLSNWHVLGGSLSGGLSGDEITQPGGSDSSDDVIARLVAERRVFDQQGDAALATLLPAMRRRLETAQFPSGHVPTGVRSPFLGETVAKCGAGTGKTWGVVSARSMEDVPMRWRESLRCEVYSILPLSTGEGLAPGRELTDVGDSGSVWYAVSDGAAVALQVGGDRSNTPDSEVAYACDLRVVMERLQVRLS